MIFTKESGLKLDGQPFEKLRICYFKAYDKKQEKIFLDATDEQMLEYITTNIHETAHILKIEDVEVLFIVTHVPDKKKLDVSELKQTKKEVTQEEINDLKKKYEEPEK